MFRGCCWPSLMKWCSRWDQLPLLARRVKLMLLSAWMKYSINSIYFVKYCIYCQLWCNHTASSMIKALTNFGENRNGCFGMGSIIRGGKQQFDWCMQHLASWNLPLDLLGWDVALHMSTAGLAHLWPVVVKLDLQGDCDVLFCYYLQSCWAESDLLQAIQDLQSKAGSHCRSLEAVSLGREMEGTLMSLFKDTTAINSSFLKKDLC